MKIKVVANISMNEIVDLKQWGISDDDWEKMSSSERDYHVSEYVQNSLDWGFSEVAE